MKLDDDEQAKGCTATDGAMICLMHTACTFVPAQLDAHRGWWQVVGERRSRCSDDEQWPVTGLLSLPSGDAGRRYWRRVSKVGCRRRGLSVSSVWAADVASRSSSLPSQEVEQVNTSAKSKPILMADDLDVY